MPRSEFRFVIDGMTLSEEQQDHVARSIQEAGARALVALKPDGPTLGLDIGRIGFHPEWIGRWLLVNDAAAAALEKLEGTVGRGI